ncbi:MAG: hypothetical protein LBQ98_05380 [Nitrososphaerota archaeon]|nr:hypothetical protein [Nitrososphaerota archaeon]
MKQERQKSENSSENPTKKEEKPDCAKSQKTMALNAADSAYRLIYCCM